MPWNPVENAIARGPGGPGRNHIFAAVLLALSLTLAACGVTGTPAGTGNPTPTTSPATPTPTTTVPKTVKVYFAHHPESDSHPNQVFAVTRTVPQGVVTTQDLATFALDQMLAGPTSAETTQGYYSPFSHATFAPLPNCPGESHAYLLTFDQRGIKAEPGTVTMRFCAPVGIAGDLDGPRMTSMIEQTLKQFSGIQQVVVLNYLGNCFADLKGTNDCLAGAAAGYPVKVYFSRHPDSDTRPAAVFAVNRMSPTLDVATFSTSQLLAGPVATEESQGYYTPLEGSLSGASSCNGADFTIKLNWNRTHAETGTATLQFCRTMRGLGDSGAIAARNEIVATLTQFPTIKKVVITNADGSCLDDLIGCPS